MRQIKFRAWDLFAKEMDYEVMIDPEGKVAAFSPLDGSYVRGFSDSEKVIMQYTGLQDRNGKDIFEGDIVVHGNECQWVETIIFEEGGFETELYHMYDIKPCEVIGNTYEHPHLLEVEING